MLSGIGMLGFWASGNASVILKPMPDWAVVGLTEMGMDAALDELVTRVSMVPNSMSDSQMSKAIEAGLAHQADLVAAFDPRWGEVLYIACVERYMSEEQLKQYMLLGVSSEVLVRDRVHRGAKKVDGLMKIAPARINALTGGYTGYSVSRKWVADGVVDQQSFGPLALVSVPKPGGWWTNSASTPIVPASGELNRKVGSKLVVYAEYDLILSAASDQYPASLNIPAQELENELVLGRFRVEHEVEIIDPGEPIVPMADDPELARRTCEAMGISAIRLLRVLPEPEPGLRTRVLSMSTYSRNLPTNIALRAYAQLDDGQEIRIGQWMTKGMGGDFFSGISWSVDNTNAQSHAQTQAILDKMIEQGQVDVIFRTDATLAESTPEIQEVIDLTMIFEAVPVEITASVSGFSSSSADDWIKGKIIEQDEGEDSEQP